MPSKTRRAFGLAAPMKGIRFDRVLVFISSLRIMPTPVFGVCVSSFFVTFGCFACG